MATIETTTTLDMAEAERAVRATLADQGFGVLTEIDVAATIKSKLGIERPAMKILGACNPSFANRALDLDADVSLFLPCNVVLSAIDRGTKISAVDPRTIMNDPNFGDLAAEVAERLTAAVAAVPAG